MAEDQTNCQESASGPPANALALPGASDEDLVIVTRINGTDRRCAELGTAMQVASNTSNVRRVSLPFRQDRIRPERRHAGPVLGELWRHAPVATPRPRERFAVTAKH